MNYRMLYYFIGNIMCIEALFMAPAFALALFEGEHAAARALLITILLLLVIGLFGRITQRGQRQFYAREGFVVVALSWIIMSLFGSLPFFLSGSVTDYMDALFETVSGFTTTGASILMDVEAMPRSLLYWRSFTHWLGGMGVLVFALAIIPMAQGSGNSIHILRAESTGPEVGKLVPQTYRTARILYMIYCVMTVAMIVILLFGGMPFFDSLCISFGSAGTGGFGILRDSCASYSPFCQGVITVFLLLFGINFSIYYMLLLREFSKAIFNEELRLYFAVFFGAVAVLTVNVLPQFGGKVGTALHHAAFQASSIMTTAGFASVDFNQWPELSKSVLLVLMVIGSCAGSTAGGIKVARLLILFKSARHGIKQLLSPRSVKIVRVNGEALDDATVRGVHLYMTFYALIAIFSLILISIDNHSLETNLSAMISCLNNIGPGFGGVGPMGNFSIYSRLSTFVLILDMLFGRLEILPMLVLFRPSVWRPSTLRPGVR